MTLPRKLEAEARAVMAEQGVDIYRARFIVALRHGLTSGDVIEVDAKGQEIAPAREPAA